MSENRANSKNKRSASTSQIRPLSDEEIDELIENITMKKPPTSFGLYIQDMFKEENKNIKEEKDKKNMIEVTKLYHKKWPKEIDPKKKQEYEETHKRLKEKYDHDVEIVKAVLIDQYDNKGATAKKLFYNEIAKQAVINNESVDDALNQAKEDWESMTAVEKKFWKEKKEENDKFWEVANKIGRLNSYTLYCRDKLKEWKAAGKKGTIQDCADDWKTLPKNEKKQYEEQAEQFNEMRMRYSEMQKIKEGITPTKPQGALRLYMLTKSEDGKYKGKGLPSMKEEKKEFDCLPQEEKDVYLKRAHRLNLAYLYLKDVAKKNIKKKLHYRNLNGYNIFVKDLSKEKEKIPKGKTLFQYAGQLWKEMDKKEKEKYEKRAEEENEKKEQELMKYEGKVFNKPPKARSAYHIYMSEMFKESKPETGELAAEIMKKFAQAWKGLSKEEQSKYEKMAEEEQKKVDELNNEYEKNGCYTLIEGVGVKENKTSHIYFPVYEEESEEEDEKAPKATTPGITKKSEGGAKRTQGSKKTGANAKGGKRKASPSKEKEKGPNKK